MMFCIGCLHVLSALDTYTSSSSEIINAKESELQWRQNIDNIKHLCTFR